MIRIAEVGCVTSSDTGPLGLDQAAAEGAALLAAAEANGHPVGAPEAPPTAPGADPTRGPRGVPPAAEAEPCGPCEDGNPIERVYGAPLPRSGEIALGVLGCFVGLIVLGMGLDLITGGLVSEALGIGGNRGNPGPG